MQLNNNEKEMNPSTNLTSLSSTTSCSTTSTDSGVIIVDNRATYNRQEDSAEDKENTHNKINNIEITKDKQEKNEESEDNQATRNSTKRSDSIKFINPTTNRTSINIEQTININGNHNEQQQQERQRRNTSKSYSPTSSIRSTTISIISIDDHAIDSSVIDTDSDLEADAEGEHANYTVKKLGQQVTYPANSPNIPAINQGLKVVSQQVQPNGFANGDVGGSSGLPANILNGNMFAVATPTTTLATPSQTNGPQIGSIALSNSTDVTFGDKHFYEGPVTIQQFLIDSRDKWKSNNGDDGQDNPNFTGPSTNGGAGYKMYQTRNEEPPPSLPRTLNRKAVWITTVFVLLSIVIGTVIATTTNIFEVALKPKSKQLQQLDDDEDSRQNIPINSTIELDNIGSGRILRIVARDAWLAQPPQQDLATLQTPIGMVVAVPTITEDCTAQSECVFRVRYLQTFDIESQQQDDISYNFLIGSDGNVYEGRGWHKQGAHSKGFNDRSVSFAYIGTFHKHMPAEKQLNVTKLLLAEGVKRGKLRKDYKFVSGDKLEPGSSRMKAPMLYASFKDWPHWSN